MEIDNKRNDYLRFYKTNNNSKSFVQKNVKQSRILPHITQQYHFRITNNLLIKKIMNPKRDKIIKTSLQKARRFIKTSSSLKNRQNNSIYNRQISTSLNYRHNSLKRQNDSFTKDKFNQVSQQKIKFFNNNNAINIKINNENQCQYQNKQDKDLNNGRVSRSNNNSSHSNKFKISSNKQNQQFKIYYGKLISDSSMFGNGPTILLIQHIEIISNPPLKRDSMIQLQLIERLGHYNIGGNQLQNYDQQMNQKVIKTRPITYMNMPNLFDKNKMIKFAIKVSKIGDFVPLRIWKYIGVQFVQIGTVDLPLNLYKIKINSQQQSQYHNLKWQFSKQRNEFGRKVLVGQVSCPLRKAKKIQINTKVIIKYKLYNKKFTKIKNISEKSQ